MERSNLYSPPVALSRVRTAAVAAVAATCAGCAASTASEGVVEPTTAVVGVSATGCRPTSTASLGVVLADELVVTVAHAVAGEDQVVVTGADGVAHEATLAAIDTTLDAAVLRVDGLEVEPADRRPLAPDERVAITVIPDDDGGAEQRDAAVLRRVTIRTTDIYRDGAHQRPAVELAADVSGGDSGAPVVADGGAVVAVVWATSRRTDGRAWALPIEAAEALLSFAEAGAAVEAVPCAR